MKKFLLASTFAAATCVPLTPMSLPAQVPQLVNHQGRIAVSTTNFNGSDQPGQQNVIFIPIVAGRT